MAKLFQEKEDKFKNYSIKRIQNKILDFNLTIMQTTLTVNGLDQDTVFI